MNKRALVRRPGPRLAEGLVTHIERSSIDLDLAQRQWEGYVAALHDEGWETIEVPPADDCPDAVFVEDTVVVYGDLAVISRPGADERRPETAAGIVERVVAEHVDTRRLTGLLRLGVDEVSYRKGHRYLTVVADHDQAGRVVWAAEGKNAATLETFYDQLGEEGCAAVEAVSMDLGAAFKKATDAKAPRARQCVDPFHLVALANEAINKARRWAWNIERDKARQAAALAGPKRRGRPPAGSPPPARDQARWVKHTRWALLKDPDTLKPSQLEVLHQLRRSGSVLYRCWQLKEGLRDLYRLAEPADAAEHLDWWLAWACRSRIPAFVTLSKTVRANRDRVLAAVELGLSNSKLEGLNSKIRLINHRGYGHHSAAALIAMIYLCCGGITINLPLR